MPHPYTPAHDLSWHGIPYLAGVPTQIPDDLAIALGLTAPAEAEQVITLVSPALALINGVDVVRELQVIPTIGAGAARLILSNRPEGGYESLEQVWALCPKIMAPPYTTDSEQVAAWGIDE